MSDIVWNSRKDEYLAEVDRVGCSRYNPCPICYKCMRKATHLYKQCAGCKVPSDGHTDKIRQKMILRKHFAITERQLGEDAMEGFRACVARSEENNE